MDMDITRIKNHIEDTIDRSQTMPPQTNLTAHPLVQGLDFYAQSNVNIHEENPDLEIVLEQFMGLEPKGQVQVLKDTLADATKAGYVGLEIYEGKGEFFTPDSDVLEEQREIASNMAAPLLDNALIKQDIRRVCKELATDNLPQERLQKFAFNCLDQGNTPREILSTLEEAQCHDDIVINLALSGNVETPPKNALGVFSGKLERFNPFQGVDQDVAEQIKALSVRPVERTGASSVDVQQSVELKDDPVLAGRFARFARKFTKEEQKEEIAPLLGELETRSHEEKTWVLIGNVSPLINKDVALAGVKDKIADLDRPIGKAEVAAATAQEKDQTLEDVIASLRKPLGEGLAVREWPLSMQPS